MICFDTGPVIWGVQQKAHPTQQEMVPRMARYLRHLARKGESIMIPAPVVQEYLIGFDADERESQQRAIERVFFVPAFDMPAAALAAEIEGNKALMQAIRSDDRLDRGKLRVDCQVVAVAVVNKAEKVITEDPHFADLAQGLIQVEPVPEIAEQLSLLDE